MYQTMIPDFNGFLAQHLAAADQQALRTTYQL
jgi:hypothetical protein